MGKFIKKQIECVRNEKDCHIVVSHKLTKFGYLRIRVNGVMTYFHREIYSQNYFDGRSIPNEFQVRHKCDNPSCINPEHLELGTNQDNVNDKMMRGRHVAKSGESHANSKLTSIQVIDIFEMVGLHKDIAKKYGVSRSLISYIKKRKIWSSITQNLQVK